MRPAPTADAAAGSGPAYRLAFLLPREIAAFVPAGRHSPCLHGCVLTIDRNGWVTIEGPSQERVLDQARRFLRIHARGRGPLQIAMTLVSSCGRWRDPWTAIVNAEIAFVPNALEAEIGSPAA